MIPNIFGNLFGQNFANAKPYFSTKQVAILSFELLLAIPFGLVLSKLTFGGIAWLLGGVGSAILVLHANRILGKSSSKPNRSARQVGLILVGMTIGSSIAHSNIADVADDLPIFVLLTLFGLLSSSIVGCLYSRLSNINLLTAMLATVPGNVGLMTSIAADYGRDVALVSLVQITRFTSVILLIPWVAGVSIGNGASTPAANVTESFFPLTPFYLGLFLLALSVAGLGVYSASYLKIPAAPFFGALMAGIAFNNLLYWLPIPNVNFSPPLLTNILGQLLLGISIGEHWGNKPTLGRRAAGYALVSVALTIAVGFTAAFLAMQLTDWDWLTCLLVTAPGGVAEMILIALALNHDIEIVAAGHIVRLIAINCSIPIWVFLFRYFDRHLPAVK